MQPKRGAGGAPATPPSLITVAKATAQDVPKYLDEIVRNAAFESVTVTPQVGGRIVERHFQDGENLKKGQLLFVICLRFNRRWRAAWLKVAVRLPSDGEEAARVGHVEFLDNAV